MHTSMGLVAFVLMCRDDSLKTGYMGFACLEYSADATPAVILSPAVDMAADVHCKLPLAGGQWLAVYMHDASTDAWCWLVITRWLALF